MSIHKIATRYAVALADLVAEKENQAVVENELSAFSDLISQSTELYSVFANPAFNKHQKEQVLHSLLEQTNPSPYLNNFLRLLLKNERLHNVKDIYQAYLQELDARKGITTARITTARPLRDDEQKQIQIQLEKLTGKQVRLELETDPSILGGVVARIGSEIYDGSILTQLENLQKQLSGG